MNELASSTNVATPPDERAFLEHIEGARFQSGVDRGDWRIVSIDWPYAVIAVAAAERVDSPHEWFLRFTLDDYPAGATATPWDVSSGVALSGDRRPKGEHVGHVFRFDWEGGRALYAPWDRVAAVGHPDWAAKHSQNLWDPGEGITSYLRRVHALLNNEDYLGV